MKDRNENRPGYKKTKVGWIPKKWKLAKLIELVELQRGFDLPHSRRLPGSVPVFASNGPVGMHDTFRANGPGVLVGRSGSVGKVTLINEDFWPLNTTLYSKNLKGNDAYYVYYFLTFLRLERFASGTSVPTLNRNDIHPLRIPLPSLSEQKKIAEILSTWDDAIKQTRKLIDAKKRRKKALMQQLLTGKKRLPGFAKSIGRKPHRFFDLPQDWECPQIKDIAKECSERNTEGYNLTVLACSKYLGFVESSEYFGKRIFSADTSNYKVIRRGYFGYPSNHIEEGSIGLLLTHDIGIVSPIYTVFKCVDSVIQEYLYAVFKTDTFRHIFAISTNASVDRRGSLRWKEFSVIRIPQPSIEEQQAIVDVLHIADNEITQLETKLKALEKQKRGLMQKLLTGEIRVKT